MKLYNYGRSSCSWRVRITLAYKSLKHIDVPIHLLTGEQHQPDHLARNPMGQVPVLELSDGRRLSQSIAIMEYVEEHWPAPPLLPTDPFDRARVRMLSEGINSGVQPLQSLSVLVHAADRFAVDKLDWKRHFVQTGLDRLEVLASVDRTERDTSPWLVGDMPTFAEICLVPQLYNARRYGCSTADWPTLVTAETAALALSAFSTTHPDQHD